MHHLSRALASARIEDLHRNAAQWHMIRLAHGVTHASPTAPVSRVPLLSGRRWIGRRDGRPRRARAPTHGAMRGEGL
jgi:hypothetical protein